MLLSKSLLDFTIPVFQIWKVMISLHFFNSLIQDLQNELNEVKLLYEEEKLLHKLNVEKVCYSNLNLFCLLFP